jgi:phospholipid/cholesterol/gamma-HCH transport system substrate-binding protein
MKARVRTSGAILVVAIAASLLAACGGGGTYKVTAIFEDIGDLQSRASVQSADVRIGSIAKITLTKDYKARVSLLVRNNIRMPQASKAYLRTTSLLGEKFVELRPDGDPTQGPFLHNGSTLGLDRTDEGAELESVADQLVTVLGAVNSTNLASIVETGAVGFGGRGSELHTLIGDLSVISSSLASRSVQIGSIIDNLDRATQTLAGGSEDVKGLLTNLATTSKILVDNREQAITALDQLSRLARVQNEVLDKYHGDIDRQIKQINAIIGVAATQTTQVGTLVDWLDRFVYALPKAIPGDFTQVYMWAVPCAADPRSPAGCP